MQRIIGRHGTMHLLAPMTVHRPLLRPLHLPHLNVLAHVPGVEAVPVAVPAAALGANKAVVCDGALVGGTATVGAADAYVTTANTGTFTAGVAKLVIEYIEVK